MSKPTRVTIITGRRRSRHLASLGLTPPPAGGAEHAADGDSSGGSTTSGACDSVPIPLVDEMLNPLPVLFPPMNPDEDERTLLGRYLDVFQAAITTPTTKEDAYTAAPVTRQRVPLRTPSREPASQFFEAVWSRRLETAQATPPEGP